MKSEAIFPTTPYSGYLRYGIVLALLGLIRVFELAMAGTELRARAYDSRSWLAVACISAIVICLFVGRYARRYFSPILSLFLSALAGGTITLVVSSIPGMAIGLCVGSLTIFDRPRRYSWKLLQLSVVFLFAGIVFGLAIGFIGSRSMLISVEAAQQKEMAMIVCAVLVCGAVVWTYLVAIFRTKHRKLLSVILFSLFFVLSLISVPFGIQLDTQLRMVVLRNQGVYLGLGPPVPFGYRNLTRGLVVPSSWQAQGLTVEQAKHACIFRDIHVFCIYYPGEFAIDALPTMDFRNVTGLVVTSPQFDDEALLAFKDSYKLIGLRIEAPTRIKVTDAGLKALENMKSLNALNLGGSEIDGSGLRHIHPQAPLNQLRLANTNVDDAALAHMASLPLVHLDLRGTRVTGDGLWRLERSGSSNASATFVPPGLLSLNLSDSAFREENLDQIPYTVSELRIDGTKLTSKGIENLVCRFYDRQTPIAKLSITNTGIDDSAVQLLAELKVNELRIDATRLTQFASASIVQATKIELVYEADQWLADGKSLDELLHHYREMKRELLELKKKRSIALPARGTGPAVSIGIHALTLNRNMIEKLGDMDEGKLYGAAVEGVEGVPELLEMDEVAQFFLEKPFD